MKINTTIPLVMLAMLVAACQESGKSTAQEESVDPICIKAHHLSVSCGWPIYFADGTRIDNEDQLLEWMESHRS